jgi:type I restriction enzyme S subunit
MPNEKLDAWQVKKVTEVAEVVGGGTPSTKDPANFGDYIPWITPKDLSFHRSRFIGLGGRYLSQKGLASSSAKGLSPGTVIVSSRAPIGLTAIATQRVSTNQGCRSLVPKVGIADSQFLYYLMSASTEYLHQHANGTTFQELPGGVFKEMTFLFPPFHEQERIATVLATIDDLVESKERLLELFDAAIQSAGALSIEASAETAQVPLTTLASVTNGYSYTSAELVDESETTLVNLKNFGRHGGFRLDGLKPFSGTPKSAQVVTPGDVLVAKTDLTQNAEVVGRCIRMPLIPQFSSYVASLDAAVVRPTSTTPKEAILALLSQPEFRDHCLGYTNGTTVLHMSKDALASYVLVLPDKPRMDQLVRLVAALAAEQDQTLADLHELTKLREFLLPRLLSGELRVLMSEVLAKGES